MIKIYIEPFNTYKENSDGEVEFIIHEGRTIRFEHSLRAVAEWEGKWKKPYLTNSPNYEKTPNEVMDYFRCMALDDIDPLYISKISSEDLIRMRDYINDTMSAVKFSDDIKSGRRSSLSRTGTETTAETIYYEMIQLGIPFECENWNLNRLLMLLRYCAEKEKPGKKMSQRDIMSRNASLNKMRRARLGSLG